MPTGSHVGTEGNEASTTASFPTGQEPPSGKVLSAIKRRRAGNGTFSAASQSLARLQCVVCFEPLETSDVATLWGDKPWRIGQPWTQSCKHECCCWTCALETASTLADRSQASQTMACPECRAPASYLRRGYKASNKSRVKVEPKVVAAPPEAPQDGKCRVCKCQHFAYPSASLSIS
jgi:hypothetical protein